MSHFSEPVGVADMPASEMLELRSMRDVFEAAPESVRRAMGWSCQVIDGTLVSVADQVPSIIINRALGLGIGRPATRQTVSGIVEAYSKAGVDRYFVHLGPAASPSELKGWLADAGLEPKRRWMKFERDTRPPDRHDTKFRIAEVTAPKMAEPFGRIVCDAFDLGEAASGMFAPLVGRPGWQLFGAFDGDELVGTGTLFVEGGHGYLNFGATKPSHRRGGAQSALLGARIEAARQLGCSRLFTDTGEAVPGDPQHSYRNIERAGFRPSHLRENYASERRVHDRGR